MLRKPYKIIPNSHKEFEGFQISSLFTKTSIRVVKIFHKADRKRQIKGTTLIEVALVIFILAVLAVIASFSFIDLSPKYQLKKAVWEINSQMNYARFKAIFYETPFRIKFDSSGYKVEKYEASHKIWALDRFGFLESVALRSNNTPTFHPKGTVSNLASIYVSNSWGSYKITLAITGRIKITKL
jgi:hypothetical protein